MPRKDLRVGICQVRIVDSDIEGNFARIEAAAREVKHHDADIACFPETALIGWGNSAAPELAQPVPGAHSSRLCELATQLEIMICCGVHELADGRLYNTALLIDRDGTVLLRHRKINLIPEVEAPPTVPGDAGCLRVAGTRLGRIGVMICADSFLPEHRAALAAQTPDLMVIPYAWAAPAAEWPQHGEELHRVVADTAKDIGCPVVGTDGVGILTGGPWKNYLVGGCSAVYWPDPAFHLTFPCLAEGAWVVAL